MRSSVALRLVGAVLITGLIGSACSDDCPNCPGSPATVTISPGNSSVLLDRELQLVALVYDKDGNLLSGHPATWSSNDDNVATVDADGKVVGCCGWNGDDHGQRARVRTETERCRW